MVFFKIKVIACIYTLTIVLIYLGGIIKNLLWYLYCIFFPYTPSKQKKFWLYPICFSLSEPECCPFFPYTVLWPYTPFFLVFVSIIFFLGRTFIFLQAWVVNFKLANMQTRPSKFFSTKHDLFSSTSTNPTLDPLPLINCFHTILHVLTD